MIASKAARARQTPADASSSKKFRSDSRVRAKKGFNIGFTDQLKDRSASDFEDFLRIKKRVFKVKIGRAFNLAG